MSEKLMTTRISTEDPHTMFRAAVIVSVAAAAALSPLAFLVPHALLAIVGMLLIPSIIFLWMEDAKTMRPPIENQLRTIAGAAFVITGILGALYSIAAI